MLRSFVAQPRATWRVLAGVVASAALLGLYARGGHAWLLGFVALVPWLLAANAASSVAGALFGGWLMSVAFVAADRSWVVETSVDVCEPAVPEMPST